MLDLSQLLTTSFLMLCLAIQALVYCLRTAWDYFVPSPSTKLNHIATELVLPLLPIVIGITIALIAHQSLLTGIVAGFTSSSVYRAVKAAMGVPNALN